MHLYWSDQDGIAAALLKAYPDEDRLRLDSDALARLIANLPAFHDVPEPPSPSCLEKIMWHWTRLAHDAAGNGGD